MAKYRFSFSEDQPKPDVVTDLADDESAHAEAVRTATQIIANAAARGVNPAGWSVTVFDGADEFLCIVSLAATPPHRD